MAARTLSLAGIFLSAAALVLLNASSFAGNKDLVEERVRELDSLNKEALSQVPDLPEKGKVEIKARVKERKDGYVFDIQEKKVTTGGTSEGEAVTGDPPVGPAEDTAADGPSEGEAATGNPPVGPVEDAASGPSGVTAESPAEDTAVDGPSGADAADRPSRETPGGEAPSIEKATPVKEGTLNFGTSEVIR